MLTKKKQQLKKKTVIRNIEESSMDHQVETLAPPISKYTCRQSCVCTAMCLRDDTFDYPDCQSFEHLQNGIAFFSSKCFREYNKGKDPKDGSEWKYFHRQYVKFATTVFEAANEFVVYGVITEEQHLEL